jgi:phosphopantothenoylcysteine decarboxylase/phosphopantothenate--cysteine ligase
MSTIILGVSASIAAYKAADLASRLVKAGHDVYPILTPHATRLIAPATFEALCGHACSVDVFDGQNPQEIGHIDRANTADAIVIAPATMDLMAKLASGIANDMLTAVVAAFQGPVLIAPGMNTGMWESHANQRNLEILRSYGYQFIGPSSGRLACGTVGMGKMAEPAQIEKALSDILASKQDLAGKKVLITAGPTREPIDAVRYLTNRSSGKMGYALANEAAKRGAEVTLVSGPVSIPAPENILLARVTTAKEMYDAALDRYDSADIVIAAAAVADYTVAHPVHGKIKKSESSLTIDLKPTSDILAEMGRRKKKQILVGFAAETDRLVEYAKDKLHSKNLDWIVANDVSKEGAGFDTDTNIVTLLSQSGKQIDLPIFTKQETAAKIFDIILESNYCLSVNT